MYRAAPPRSDEWYDMIIHRESDEVKMCLHFVSRRLQASWRLRTAALPWYLNQTQWVMKNKFMIIVLPCVSSWTFSGPVWLPVIRIKFCIIGGWCTSNCRHFGLLHPRYCQRDSEKHLTSINIGYSSSFRHNSCRPVLRKLVFQLWEKAGSHGNRIGES